jgi:hypothetical protein
MVFSLYNGGFEGLPVNAIDAYGLAGGAFIGWVATKRPGSSAAFWTSVGVGAFGGIVLFIPLVLATREGVLVASGTSLGILLALPFYLCMRLAIRVNERAVLARIGSVVRAADQRTVHKSVFVVVIGVAALGFPRLRFDGRTWSCDLPVLFGVLLGMLGITVADARAFLVLLRTPEEPEARAGDVRFDVGLGDEAIEVHEPGTDAYRMMTSVTRHTVGNVAAGRRVLQRSLAGSAILLGLTAWAFACSVFRILRAMDG